MENNNIDWFDLVVHNPEKSTEDLALAGISESNLTFKDSDYYKNIPEVKNMFENSDGTFNDEKYNKFYKNISKMYSDYVTRSQEYEAFNKDYNLDDMRDRNRLTGEVYLKKVANPTKYKQGLSGIFKTTEGQLSRREAMQNSEVRDWKTGISLGYTPNDDDKRGLFDFLGLEPLVEAVWEEDGTHVDPISGQTVKHSKGDLKTDENGNYYYETLGDRDASGKSFLKVWDTLTVDGTFWNKFDPFDSDGVSKNIGGQIAKTAAIVAPLLIPGVNTAYGYIMAGALLTDALSTFGKAGTEMLDPDYKNNKLWNSFNLYGAFMRRFDNSSSDENGYFEQGTNMLSSVASQLFQQRAIAQIPSLLKWNKSDSKVIREFVDKYGDSYIKQYGKSLSKALADGDITATNLLTEKSLLDNYNRAMKMGKRASDASKLYMIVTQSQGVYDTFKENGFDETTTALGLLGTAYGFNKLFNTSLGEVALSGLGLDELGAAVKPVTKKLAQDMSESLSKLAPTAATAETKNATISAIRKYADNFVNKFKDSISNSSGLRADMLKESIEETSEELLQDSALLSAQSINWALDKLNLKEDKNTYNYFETNPLERYLMSAVGGAMGSAVFTGLRKWESMINGNTAISELPKDDLKNLIKIVSSNPVSEVKRSIENSTFGSKTLSAQLETAPDGTSYFKPASSYEESQDSIIKKTMLSIVDSIDSAINSEVGKLSKDNIINSALGRDIRARVLADQSYDVLQNIANDFNNTVSDLIQAKAKISSIKDGDSPSKTDIDLYNEAKNKYDQLINGERASEYIEKTAFLLNRGISSAFKNDLDIYTFAMSRGKNYAAMSPEEKAELDEIYKVKVSSDLNKEDSAFQTFKFFRDKTLTDLQNISLQSENLKARKELQDASEDIEDRILKRFISKDKIENLQKSLEEERDKNLDKFIEDNKLDPNKEAQTADQKLNLANNFISSELYKYSLEELSKIPTPINNIGMGVNTLLLSAPNDILVEYSNLLNGILSSNTVVDSEVVDTLKRIYDNLNRFNFNDYSALVFEKVKQALDSGEILSFDSYNADSLYGKVEGLENSGEDSFMSKNPDGTYHISSGDIEEDIELSDSDIKSLINDTFSGSVENVGQIFGGILPDSESGGFNIKGSLGKIIKESIDSSLESNPNLDLLGSISENLGKIKERTIVNSPLRKMLETLSKELTGENVFSIINNEEKLFKSLTNLSDYTIRNKITEGQLRAALGVISMAKSILKYSEGDPDSPEFGSMIDIVNASRKKSGLPEIPVIDSYAITIWDKDLNKLKSDISYLLDLSSNNSVSKLKESSLSLARNEVNLIYLLSDTANNSALFKGQVIIEGKPFFDFDFSDSEQYFQSLVKDGFKDSENPEVLTKIDSVFTSMQEYYFNKFNSLSQEEKEELIEILAKNRKDGEIGLNYLDNFETKINRSSTVDDLSPEFIGNFIMSMFAINQKELKGSFLKVLAEDSTYAPFFGQYLSISMAMAMELNPDLINEYLDKKNSLNPELMGIMFPSITVINGDPGSGKTTSVAYFIKQLLKSFNPDAKILASAPNSDQASKLAKLLKEPTGLSKKELFNEVLTEKGVSFYEGMMEDLLNNGGRKYGTGLKLSNISNLKDLVKEYNDPVYLFIDEYTHFSSYEMDLLTKIPNLRIVGLGDTKQEGFKVSGLSNYISGIVYSTPSLMMSVRAANGHKQDNLTILSSVLRSSLEDSNRSALDKTSLDLSGRYNLLSKETYLKYYEDADKFQGDKIVSSVSESYLRNLISKLGEKEKITLITNKTSSPTLDIFTKLVEDFPEKINIKNADDVQGSEYKYVVVDVAYGEVRGATESSFNSSFLNTLRAFYTHITRSSDGSIIISKGNNIPVAGSTKMEYSSNSELQQSDIDRYKTIISDVFSKSSNASTIEPTPSESGKKETPKDISKVEKDLQRREKEILEQDKEPSFRSENMPLYFDSKHIGLTKSSDGTYIPNQNKEDLNGVLSTPTTESELLNSKEYKAWSLIKHYCYYPDKDDFILALRQGTENIDIFSSFSKLLTGDENNLIEFLNILEKGQLKLKISKSNPETDYEFGNTSFSRKSKNFARVVLQLKGLDGSKYDITVADIPESSNIENEDFKELLEKDYATPKYFDLDFSKIQLRGFGSDLGKNKYENKYGIPLEMLQKMHPELTISNVYYESYGSKKGKPYVLITDRIGASESDILNSYGNTPFEIIKKEVSQIPYSFDEYFDTLSILFDNRHNSKIDYFKLRKFVPTALSSRFIAAIYRLQYLLRNESELEKYNKDIQLSNTEAEKFNAEAEKAGGLLRKIIKTPIDNDETSRRTVNSIVSKFSELIPVNSTEMIVSDASIKDYRKQIRNKKLSQLDSYLEGITVPIFSEAEIKFINKFKDRKLSSLFKELSNPDSSLYKDSSLISSNPDKTGEQILAEKAQIMSDSLAKLSEDFSGKTLESVSELFNSNLLFYTLKDLKIVEYFTRLEGDQQKLFRTALEASGLFDNGIWSQGRDVEAGYIEGYIKAAVGKDKVYMFNRISPRKAYIPYTSIKVVENSSQSSEDINTLFSNKLDEIRKDIDPNLLDKFDSIISKFSLNSSWTSNELEEELNKYINNNYQRIKKLVWDTSPKLVSLQWKNNKLTSVNVELTRDILLSSALNPDLLSSITNESINFSNKDGSIFIKSSNGGMAIEVKLDNDGNIRLVESIIQEDENSDLDNNLKEISITDFSNLLNKHFKMSITEDVSNLILDVNKESDLNKKVELISSYIQKAGKKVGTRTRRAIENMFKTDNNSKC